MKAPKVINADTIRIFAVFLIDFDLPLFDFITVS